MPAEPESSVPEGAAVFPLIPAELRVNPLLLAVIHATVFLAGSSKKIVDPAAADEALQRLAGYLRRLDDAQMRPLHEDMECLISYARKEKWPRQLIQSLRSFLTDVTNRAPGESA
jgi:hypothetical protein